MKKEDWKSFREYLNGTYEQYGKPPISDTGARIMFEALRDLTLAQAIQGMNTHVQRNRFVPPNAASVKEAIQGLAEDNAILAYDTLLDAHKRVNSGESVKFDDPCIHFALKQCRGWTGFCHMDEAESRNIFIRSYVAAFRNNVGWGQVDAYMPGEREINHSILCPWSPDQIVEIRTIRQDDVKQITA